MLCSSKLVSFSFCFDKWHNLRAIFVKVNMQNFIFLYKIWFLINDALKNLCRCWVIKLCKWDIWMLCKTTQVSPFFLAKCLCFSSVSLSTNTDHLKRKFRAFILDSKPTRIFYSNLLCVCLCYVFNQICLLCIKYLLKCTNPMNFKTKLHKWC